MPEKIIFITAFVDRGLYSRCVTHNPFIRQHPQIACVSFDNSTDNRYISKRYNQFLDSWDHKNAAWFVFCHSDWELLQDITQELPKLDRNAIYGPIGTIVKRRYKKLVNIYCGYCRERSRDGSESRILSCKKQKTGTTVDTLDAQCMIIHSSLIKKYSLRFDESFAFDLYCEDFSVNAKIKHGIKTRILRLECRHNNIAKNMDGREDYYRMKDIFNKKYPNLTFGSTVTILGKIDKKTRHVFPVIKEE